MSDTTDKFPLINLPENILFKITSFRSFLLNAFAPIYFILKYFSKISFSHLVLIYLFNVDFFLLCFCEISNKL